MSDTNRQLEIEKTASDLAIKEARRLEVENRHLKLAIAELRRAVRRLIALHEGAVAKNAIQRGKDLL